jgi:hypothetical protein
MNASPNDTSVRAELVRDARFGWTTSADSAGSIREGMSGIGGTDHGFVTVLTRLDALASLTGIARDLRKKRT